MVKGMVDHLAPGEDIRSARFYGDVGFVVTFKKTDPLYTIDFSEPEAPRVRGELKIPGFSTYMHMIDEGHVMSIGYDADDQGDFAWFQGILLQIFDVTDLDAPTLTHKEVIGTRGSASDAATNHLAFNYFTQRGLLGIPMVICEGGSGGDFGDTMTFSGLLVYKVDPGAGFTSVGGVPHPPARRERGRERPELRELVEQRDVVREAERLHGGPRLLRLRGRDPGRQHQRSRGAGSRRVARPLSELRGAAAC